MLFTLRDAGQLQNNAKGSSSLQITTIDEVLRGSVVPSGARSARGLVNRMTDEVRAACAAAFLGALLVLVASAACAEDGIYVAAGHDFIPDSVDAAVGYQVGNTAFELAALKRGREEPLTKPGPQLSLNVLATVPGIVDVIKVPAFAKVGLVTGTGKRGYNVGVGADLAVNARWAIRGQITHYRVTEDIAQGYESENLISLGLKYSF